MQQADSDLDAQAGGKPMEVPQGQREHLLSARREVPLLAAGAVLLFLAVLIVSVLPRNAAVPGALRQLVQAAVLGLLLLAAAAAGLWLWRALAATTLTPEGIQRRLGPLRRLIRWEDVTRLDLSDEIEIGTGGRGRLRIPTEDHFLWSREREIRRWWRRAVSASGRRRLTLADGAFPGAAAAALAGLGVLLGVWAQGPGVLDPALFRKLRYAFLAESALAFLGVLVAVVYGAGSLRIAAFLTAQAVIYRGLVFDRRLGVGEVLLIIREKSGRGQAGRVLRLFAPGGRIALKLRPRTCVRVERFLRRRCRAALWVCRDSGEVVPPAGDGGCSASEAVLRLAERVTRGDRLVAAGSLVIGALLLAVAAVHGHIVEAGIRRGRVDWVYAAGLPPIAVLPAVALWVALRRLRRAREIHRTVAGALGQRAGGAQEPLPPRDLR